MRSGSIAFRALAGGVVVAALSAVGAVVWHGLLGHGLPVRGQWDPLVGQVGPRAIDNPESLITLQQAWERYRDGMSRFVDARSPEHFADGHIEGAVNVPSIFDENPDYEPYFEAFEQEIRPEYGIPLVVYCSGADCDDSHLLQGKLLDRGYFPVEIMFVGFDGWKSAGHPVVLGEGVAPEKPLYPSTPLRMPMLAGMILMVGWFTASRLSAPVRSLWNRPAVSVVFRLVLGGVFLYAAIYKIADPGSFAKAIYGYRILPGDLINLSAMYLPWLEFVAGALVIAGAFTRGSSLVLVVLLAVFIAAIGYNVARGHSFDCGCFQKAESEHVSDPVELLFRDVALLFMGLQVIGLRAPHPGLARLIGRNSSG
jgi:rhodanese-related sulfurtransferase/uncharacterized membrane protein YphA (DoxX/SURF4 family)